MPVPDEAKVKAVDRWLEDVSHASQRSTFQTLVGHNHAHCNGPTKRMKLECYEQIMECGIRKGELVICYPTRY